MKGKWRIIASVMLVAMMILTTTMYHSAFAASMLGKVKGIKATVNANKKTIKLTWKKVKGANGYVIYKNTKKKFKKKHATNVKKARKTYKKLKVGKTYYFKIRAFKKTKSGKKYGKATVKKVRLVKAVVPTTNKPTTQSPTTNIPTTKVPTTKVPTPTSPFPPKTNQYDSLLGMSQKTVGNTMVSPITGDTYTLEFIDDFKGTSLNSSNWTPATKNSNQMEEQVNRKENVVVENDLLNLYGKKEDKTYVGDAESWETPKVSNFTGGIINSNGKQSFKYGRLEIYCRIPYSYGMWPAFWTVGVNRGWPWGGEIDIMEFVGGVDQWNNYRDDEYNCGIHWSDPTTPSDKAWGTNVTLSNGDPDSKWNRTDVKMNTGGKFEIPGGPTQGAMLHDEWRVCGVEWTETTMYFYCDDNVFHEIDITKTSMREAFHQKHYLILNLVMGGSWAGTPDEAKGTVFPQKFQVDWVKVWQK